MSLKTKKIIAREGLIIVGIIILSILLTIVSKQINRPMRILPLDDWVESPQDETDAINKILDLREKYPQYNDLTNMELAKRMAKKYPDWENVYKVIQRINEESKNLKYNYATSKPAKIKRSKLSEQVSTLSYWILIFGYPLYLLIRFILWAIKTLKQKEYK